MTISSQEAKDRMKATKPILKARVEKSGRELESFGKYAMAMFIMELLDEIDVLEDGMKKKK